MAKNNQHIILDFNKLFNERQRRRGTDDLTGEIQMLIDRRESQKTWNFKRGALIRKYKKILDDPNQSEAKKKIAKREIDSFPLYDLSMIDNEIKRLKNEDYVVTIKWKSGDYQILASELKSKENPSLFILELIEESLQGIQFPPTIKEKILHRLQYNINALQEGRYSDDEVRDDLVTETFGPIMFDFIGDYILINF